MGDYGHDLRFGTFITPSAREPQRTVQLAVATERAGLDLVTFQDHPYQPAFWTPQRFWPTSLRGPNGWSSPPT